MASFNPLVVAVGSPPIPEAKAWGQTYHGTFGPFVDLSQAVPGYLPEPRMLLRLAEAAGNPSLSGYGPILGDEALRHAYAHHVSDLYRGAIEAAEIAITAGCNQAFFACMIGLAKAGDAIILPYPWYFNHHMSLAMLGIETRPLRCRPEAGFVPDPTDAEALVDQRVKAVVLVTPNNPTGAIYPNETIEAFSSMCERHGLALVLDETYRDFLAADQSPPHSLFKRPNWQGNVIQLYSFSKAYCIPGHRVGALIAAAAFLEEMAKILDNIQICPPRAGQQALVWALDALTEWRAHNRDEISRRATALRDAFGAAEDWHVESIGAYFAYVRHPFADCSATRTAAKLAAERGVLGLPGSYFGVNQERHLRLAFANVTADVLKTLGSRFAGFAVEG